ncbi:MAG: hypothetical protein D6B25_15955 [Desulfobulbaceae bacterium]|nr:MAG: hypothetical protein D6B25_15955 [Desulfobulbaceae bacterium]
MDSLKTLIFPDTILFQDKYFPLFLFFAPINYLAPIEGGNDEDDQSEFDIFMERNLCQAHTPSPLGKNRERFVHLINDIRVRKDDYAAQLSSLTVAGLSTKSSDKKSEKRTEIINTLLTDGSNQSAVSDQDEIECWQSRLVLKIAEILDHEEAELQNHLSLLDSREMNMFKKLQGEDAPDDDDPFARLEEIRQNLLRARPGEMKKRFYAWFNLMKPALSGMEALWFASSQDSGDQIFSLYEELHTNYPVPILELPFPARIPISATHLLKEILAFREATATARKGIVEELFTLANDPEYSPLDTDKLLPTDSEKLRSWNQLLDEMFPEHVNGRCSVRFYLLQDTTIPQLLGIETRKDTDHSHGLLAVLSD